MINKSLFTLILAGVVSVSFVSLGFAQSEPAAPVADSVEKAAPAVAASDVAAPTAEKKFKKHAGKKHGIKGQHHHKNKKAHKKMHHKRMKAAEKSTDDGAAHHTSD